MKLSGLLPYIEIAFAILAIVGILLQRNEANLGAAFGGGDMGGTYNTRRGFDKGVFIFTTIVSILFVATTIATLIY